jgi:hypothetical protein
MSLSVAVLPSRRFAVAKVPIMILQGDVSEPPETEQQHLQIERRTRPPNGSIH